MGVFGAPERPEPLGPLWYILGLDVDGIFCDILFHLCSNLFDTVVCYFHPNMEIKFINQQQLNCLNKRKEISKHSHNPAQLLKLFPNRNEKPNSIKSQNSRNIYQIGNSNLTMTFHMM